MSYVGHPSDCLCNNIVVLLVDVTNNMRENKLINNGFSFFSLFSYLSVLAQTGFLSNVNLFVLVSEDESNFNLLSSRDPLKKVFWEHFMNNNVTVNRIWYLGVVYAWTSMFCGLLRVHETCTAVWNNKPSIAKQMLDCKCTLCPEMNISSDCWPSHDEKWEFSVAFTAELSKKKWLKVMWITVSELQHRLDWAV